MTEGTETICVQGARVHNLKNIDVEIPRDSLTVITGLSGSGKSSLAFDTLFVEGQRRYIETFSAYARLFSLKALIMCCATRSAFISIGYFPLFNKSVATNPGRMSVKCISRCCIRASCASASI